MVTQSEIINKNFKQLSEENKVNNSYLTGDISTEKKMFEQVKEMKHSTFDRSKFTVAGTPTITDDGVASGFSGGNKLLTILDIANFNNFEINIPIKTSDINTNKGIFYLNNGERSVNIGLDMSSSGKLTLRYWSGSSVSYKILEFLPSTNSDYKLKLKYENNTISVYVNNAFIDSISNFTITKIHEVYIGMCNLGGGTYTYFNGTIDLKQFSIAVDGVEVFNSNKTGVDQIKKDDYGIIGSPVITADGVASGFSSANGVNILNTIPFTTLDVGKTYTFKSNVTFSSDNSTTQYILLLGPCSVYLNQSALFIQYNNYTTQIYDTGYDKHTNKNVDIISVFDLKNNKLAIKVIDTSTGETLTDKNANISAPSQVSFNTARIGQNGNMSFNGQIDLNSFKIYVDGNLVYQPTLRIPYTQSKTGSKIVDVVYRDRVQDMYEQFGYAPYYTLGETDFTLPMGEIYGMIERKTDLATATKASFPSNRFTSLNLGASGTVYTAPANGWFVLRKVATRALQQIEVINSTTGVGYFSSGDNGAWVMASVPARKNDEIHILYTASGETKVFGFVYAEGEN